MVALQPEQIRAVIQYRSSTGGGSSFSGLNGTQIPYWVKLTRAGNSFTGFASQDGASWTQIGSSVSITMATDVYVGLAISSTNNSQLTTATLDSVTVTGSTADFYVAAVPRSRTTSPSSSAEYTVHVLDLNDFDETVTLSASGLPTDTTASFSPSSVTAPGTSTLTLTTGSSTPLEAHTILIAGTYGAETRTTTAVLNVLPSPWMNEDIGSVGVSGSGTYSGSTFTIKGSGADIWNSSDAFHYVYQPLSGDGIITARVSSVQDTFTYTKAGVMIREALTAGSRNAMVELMPNQSQVVFQWRSSTGGGTSASFGPSASAPYWVRLEREGDSFKAYASSNGSSWTQIGSAQTITMATDVYVGLAVSAVNNVKVTTATFDNVSGP